MTMSLMLGLDWGLGMWMLTLAEPSNLDLHKTKRIQKDIDFELDVKLLLDSWVGSTSRRN
jgi:hypothetical protein